MPLTKCSECGKEISDTATACPSCGAHPKQDKKVEVKAQQTRAATAIFWILVLGFALWILNFVGGGSHETPASQAIVAKAPPPPSISSAASSATNENQDKPEPWEPIGKYTKKEISDVSNFVGIMQGHLRRMDSIENRVSTTMRSSYRNADADAMYKSFTNYDVDALEENEKISQLEIPNIENPQAGKSLREALDALRASSDVQKEKASTMARVMQSGEANEEFAAQIKELELQRMAKAMKFVMAYAAYESYGFTSAMVDEKTGRLKANAKPDRQP